jgi:hypothetical protein
MWDRIQRDWQLYRPSARRRWQKLSDGDLELTAGNRQLLVRTIERRYGVSGTEAERQVDLFAERCSESVFGNLWQ